MEHLTRTRVDRFDIKDSLRLDEIETIRDEAGWIHASFRWKQPLRLCRAEALPEADAFLYNGNPCFKGQLDAGDGCLDGLEDGLRFRMYDSKGHFVGVYEYQDGKHWWKPWKMFLAAPERT